MNPFTAASNGGSYWWHGSAKHKEIEHKSTVVTCNNKHEQSYVLSWCESKEMLITDHIKKQCQFPVHLSVYGNIAGFLFESDRALYYMSFIDFMEKAK